MARQGLGETRELNIRYVRIIKNTVNKKGFPLFMWAGEGGKKDADGSLRGVYEVDKSYVEPSQPDKVVVDSADAAILCYSGAAIACDETGEQVSIYGDEIPERDRHPRPAKKSSTKQKRS